MDNNEIVKNIEITFTKFEKAFLSLYKIYILYTAEIKTNGKTTTLINKDKLKNIPAIYK